MQVWSTTLVPDLLTSVSFIPICYQQLTRAIFFFLIKPGTGPESTNQGECNQEGRSVETSLASKGSFSISFWKRIGWCTELNWKPNWCIVVAFVRSLAISNQPVPPAPGLPSCLSISKGKDWYRPWHSCQMPCFCWKRGKKRSCRLAGRCGSSKKWTIFYKSDQFNLHSSPPTISSVSNYGSFWQI